MTEERKQAPEVRDEGQALGGGWDRYAQLWAAAHGGYDPRAASPVVRGWLRGAYRIGMLFIKAGVRSPNVVTLLGLLLSVAVPFTAAGRFAAAGAVLVLLSAVSDTVDGVLAVVAGRATRIGQVYDGAADRLSELCWLAAFVRLGAPVWLAVTCGALMWLHEYIRAKATSAGMSEIGAVTVAERPTRILVTIFGLLAVAAVPDHRAAAVTLAVLAILAVAGLAQLTAAVRKALR